MGITIDDAETHIPDVYEYVVGEVKITTLSNRQFCVVTDPVGADGVQQYGHKELRTGDRSFFLRPGEALENGIQNVYVLGADEDGKKRQAGELWMIYGACEFVPPVTVEIVE